jgi:hypothetical protein
VAYGQLGVVDYVSFLIHDAIDTLKSACSSFPHRLKCLFFTLEDTIEMICILSKTLVVGSLLL